MHSYSSLKFGFADSVVVSSATTWTSIKAYSVLSIVVIFCYLVIFFSDTFCGHQPWV